MQLSELGQEVPIGTIEQALNQLRHQDDSRAHASLINLVVYSEKPGALIENSALVKELTREHACRAILVGIDRHAADPSLRAWITAHCHLSHGRKSVCCEQIAFQLTGVATGRFRNTVFAHLQSDLPLIFWWQGEISDIFTERLAAVIDRFIFDSSEWANASAAFQKISATIENHSDLILQDLEWTRGWQFRVGIAGIFDEPAAQNMLAKIDQIEITHHPVHRNAALQLLAWLTIQAAWQALKNSNGVHLKSKHGRIEVKLIPKPDGPPLSSCIITAGSQYAKVIHPQGSQHIERIFHTGAYQSSSLAPADPTAPYQLLGLQLARMGKNRLFNKILPRFRELLEAL
ncbi:MAG: glucose-6-phosphate dehydrogenase assembly protein OpcA [Luteolibacter sp.]